LQVAHGGCSCVDPHRTFGIHTVLHHLHCLHCSLSALKCGSGCSVGQIQPAVLRLARPVYYFKPCASCKEMATCMCCWLACLARCTRDVRDALPHMQQPSKGLATAQQQPYVLPGCWRLSGAASKRRSASSSAKSCTHKRHRPDARCFQQQLLRQKASFPSPSVCGVPTVVLRSKPYSACWRPTQPALREPASRPNGPRPRGPALHGTPPPV
jgi:hypothetical protein